MDRQTPSPGARSCRCCDLDRCETVLKATGRLLKDDRPEERGSNPANGNGVNAPSTLQHGEAEMNWWTSLKKIWTGEVLKEEEEQSRRVRTEVRNAIAETRAMLDGEDTWLQRTL
jgi:hypothetical protein